MVDIKLKHDVSVANRLETAIIIGVSTNRLETAIIKGDYKRLAIVIIFVVSYLSVYIL